MLCSMLVCIPLAYYYGTMSNYLGNTGFLQPASTMTIGQMSEIIFMLLIPFFFRRLGVKWMILVGMLSWVLRYLLFAFGAPDQAFWMIMLGVALHGICYDFFFVTGQIYVDQQARPEIRGQAQSFLVIMTQGLGMYLGAQIMTGIVVENTSGEGAAATADWGQIWWLPCLGAGAILAVFLLLFRRNFIRWGNECCIATTSAAANESEHGNKKCGREHKRDFTGHVIAYNVEVRSKKYC